MHRVRVYQHLLYLSLFMNERLMCELRLYSSNIHQESFHRPPCPRSPLAIRIRGIFFHFALTASAAADSFTRFHLFSDRLYFSCLTFDASSLSSGYAFMNTSNLNFNHSSTLRAPVRFAARFCSAVSAIKRERPPKFPVRSSICQHS